MIKISDEIVREADKIYWDDIDGEDGFDSMKKALTAVLPKLMVKVKPLDWFSSDDSGDWWGAETGTSEGGGGDYGICKEDGYYFTLNDEPMIKAKGDENWDTVDEAKAAAQADYEKRLLTCLEITAK